MKGEPKTSMSEIIDLPFSIVASNLLVEYKGLDEENKRLKQGEKVQQDVNQEIQVFNLDIFVNI